MFKKISILCLAIALSFTLIGCSEIQETIEEITTKTIDVNYALDSDAFETYISDEGNSVIVNAAIALSATVEVTVDISYSYTETQYTPFGGGSSRTVTGEVTSQATAFFINDDGYLLTNAHVVTLEDYESLSDFTYEDIDIYFNYADSTIYFDAEVIAYDQTLDLAVLKTDATQIDNLAYLSLYDLTDPSDESYGTNESIELYYGETVIAVGNANGYGLSVTEGVISAPVRYFSDEDLTIPAIQTDTAVNSGNSGGPLLNKYGYVIGIVTFKIVADDTEGLGYALPTYLITSYIDSLDLDIVYTTVSS